MNQIGKIIDKRLTIQFYLVIIYKNRLIMAFTHNTYNPSEDFENILSV